MSRYQLLLWPHRLTALMRSPDRHGLVVGKFSPPQSGAPAWSHPVIADGVLYLRDQNLLMAYDVKAN